MVRKVDVNLIKALNAGAEGQKVEKFSITKTGIVCKRMNVDEAQEYLKNYGKDNKGD